MIIIIIIIIIVFIYNENRAKVHNEIKETKDV